MRGWALGLLACGACAAEDPQALMLEAEADEHRGPDAAAIVPFGEREAPSTPRVEPVPVAEDAPLVPSPLLEAETVHPHLAFSWSWGGFAGSESCNFGVEFVGGPAVSEDGRYVLHDRRDEYWESDGGETWEDDYDQEPLREGGLALLDRTTAETTWLGPLLTEAEVPHHPGGGIHCRKLEPLLRRAIERVNAKVPEGDWRAMRPVEDVGIRLLSGHDAAAELERTEADRRPVELLFRNDALVVRRKGVSVLHREDLGPLERCNMPLALIDAIIDVDTGFAIATIDKHCVCFGDESQRHFAFTLDADARAEVTEMAAIGRAIRDDERW